MKETIVSYKYFMDQKEYLGGDVCLAYFMERKDYAEIYNKINEAHKIRIFVNPEDFNQSVVVNGFSFNIFVIFHIALFFNFVGFLFLFKKQPNNLRFHPIMSIGLFLIIISTFYIFVPDKYIPKYNLTENIVILEYK